MARVRLFVDPMRADVDFADVVPSGHEVSITFDGDVPRVGDEINHPFDKWYPERLLVTRVAWMLASPDSGVGGSVAFVDVFCS
jgi:hypothetical protein